MRYSNQLVQVRARVSIGFEDFSLVTSGCGEQTRSVWLIYGGDEPTPTVSLVNDRERQPGSVLEINGRPIPLERTAALQLFKRRLIAARLGYTEDPVCGGDCHLYVVTATLTGIFFAAPEGQLSYGHFGCCHLFAIENVANVSAERTAVPAGGQFACATDRWTVPAAQVRALEGKRKPCRTLYNCGEMPADEISSIAAHWNVVIDPANGTSSAAQDSDTWHSSDLLTTYSLRFERQTHGKNEGALLRAVASRIICKPVEPPYSMSTPIGCRYFRSEFPVSKSDAMAIQAAVKLGRDPWRLATAESANEFALEDAARRWGLVLVSDLKKYRCESPIVVQRDQFVTCYWADMQGMQALSVQITRLGVLHHWRSWGQVPWVLTRADATTCSAEQ